MKPNTLTLTVGLIIPALTGTAAPLILSAPEAAGKRLYTEGSSGTRHMPQAIIGSESTQVPASTVPCSGCHGEDGRGRSEGGVAPPDITWPELAKPYGHRHSGGRHHPAFDEKALAAAITKGVDPGGNRLDPTMPRYVFSRPELASLTAYLKRLDHLPVPGVGDDVIHIGALLPLKGPMAAEGLAVRTILNNYFDDINSRGGIFQRKLRMEVAEAGETPQATLENLRALIRDDRLFALISALAPAPQNEVSELLDHEGVPIIGHRTTESALSPLRFFIYPGVSEPLRVLVDHAAEAMAMKAPRWSMLIPEGDVQPETLAALRKQGHLHGWNDPLEVRYARGDLETGNTIAELKRGGVELVVFLGDVVALKALLQAASAKEWQPTILLTESVLENGTFGLNQATGAKLLMALPAPPSTTDPAVQHQLETWGSSTGDPLPISKAQTSAFAAAVTMVEGLKRSGRNLSRSKWAAGLETLSDFATGATPPLRFGRNHHVGITGAQVYSLDLQKNELQPLGDWREPR